MPRTRVRVPLTAPLQKHGDVDGKATEAGRNPVVIDRPTRFESGRPHEAAVL